MADLSYLVMTAADCASYNEEHPHNIVSLNQMLEVRAKEQPDTICVGFTTRSSSDDVFGCDTLTFLQLFQAVCKTASHLTHSLDPPLSARKANDTASKRIALLAPSCKEFLVNFFALVRLGYAVLLVAPQNTAEDVARLCEAVQAKELIYHDSMKKAATAAGSLAKGTLRLLPLISEDEVASSDAADATASRSQLSAKEESDTECIIFHSSGSSGTPKPIPQKHKVWTKSACCKPYTPAFTTTPLFHGGISDLLRAMMSSSTLYIYPSTLPITASNLLKAFKAVPQPMTSFLSVPYILDMLGATEEGLAELARLDLVSTGGSPLPPAIGDTFCKHGIKLVSRYGSSECGFLMTSFRDFENDKDWSHLRTTEASRKWLNFEDQGDGSAELIVPEAWPTRSKSNRPDGGFATGDLFRKHPKVPHAWMLSGRSDDVLLLINGEKASPAPLEAVFRASPLVADALVFGSNKAALGAAIIPVSSETTSQDLSVLLKEANRIAPAHAQVQEELFLLLEPTATFPKSSKGTLQRGRAYEAYAEQIEQAYQKLGSSSDKSNEGGLALFGQQLIDFIKEIVKENLGFAEAELKEDSDLFAEGLNSLQSVRIRNKLQSALSLGRDTRLPANIVFECATIKRLADYIEGKRQGSDEHWLADQELELMRRLATRPDLTTFSSARTTSAHPNGSSVSNGSHRTCVITGATGSLGAQLIPQLLQRRNIGSIICLVRAENDELATKRVRQSLVKQRIKLSEEDHDRLQSYASKFAEERLGLAEETYTKLRQSVSLVIHAAWPVHFGLSLSSFESHLLGLHTLIQLAADASSNHAHFFFCSSTASVLGGSSSDISEKLSRDPKDAAAMGYARSKHVAEAICQSAWEGGLQRRIGILRLGQLCGDTKEGVWKPEEGWPLLIASADLVGGLPELDETLSWLPTDAAAEAICDIAFHEQSLSEGEEVPVFHVLSADHSKTFESAAEDLKAAGLAFEPIPTRTWLERLEKIAEEGNSQHPSLKMLDVWRKNYGKETTASSEPVFEMARVQRFTSALSAPVDAALLQKMLAYWHDIDFIKSE